jgi:transaldolase
MEQANNLKVKVFADGADKDGMLAMHGKPFVKGFTTNPTLMRKAGITDYEAFAKDILSTIKDYPISFEVFSDDFAEMKKQALKIASWGENVYVKIPVTNTKGETCYDMVRELAAAGVKQNVTALFTLEQVQAVTDALSNGPAANISVFAGRIADTGVDCLDIMKKSLDIMRPYPQLELIWASPRELYNVVQADEIGCHIITVTNSIIDKLSLLGKDLSEYSLETVKMFYQDATAAGYKIDTEEAVSA